MFDNIEDFSNNYKLENIKVNDIDKCSIRMETTDKMIMTKCNHNYCFDCISHWFKTSGSNNCPYCRKNILFFECKRIIKD